MWIRLILYYFYNWMIIFQIGRLSDWQNIEYYKYKNMYMLILLRHRIFSNNFTQLYNTHCMLPSKCKLLMLPHKKYECVKAYSVHFTRVHCATLMNSKFQSIYEMYQQLSGPSMYGNVVCLHACTDATLFEIPPSVLCVDVDDVNNP